MSELKRAHRLKHKKKPWYKPIVMQVKLNPEQAILSCCEQILKGPENPPLGCIVGGADCPTSGGSGMLS